MTHYTDPFRLRVQKGLAAALEQITPANGYRHDLTGAVFRGRDTFGATDPLPMLSILEAPIQPDQPPSIDDAADEHGRWEVVIQGFVADDKKNPTDPAHVLMADVRRALALERKNRNGRGVYDMLGMGGLVTGLDIGSGVVRPPDELSAKAYFWLTIVLHIVEDLENPYDD